jgi:FkbM family methyltransferase
METVAVKQCGGVWLPDHETHMVEWMTSTNKMVDGRLTYQWKKQEFAFGLLGANRRIAVDAGAHVGTWTVHFAKRFKRVEAFEPVGEHRECLTRNIDGLANVFVHKVALGSKSGSRISIEVPDGSSGGSHVNGDGNIDVMRLDDYGLTDVDFMKIDVEGYEYFMVQGAEQTIRSCRPIVVIEQKPKGLAERYGHGRFDALDLLKSWGATVIREMGGDFFLAWR